MKQVIEWYKVSVPVGPTATFLTVATLERLFGAGSQGTWEEKQWEIFLSGTIFSTFQAGSRGVSCFPLWGFRLSCVQAGEYRSINGNFTTSWVVLVLWILVFSHLSATFQSPQISPPGFRAAFRVDRVCLAILPRIKTHELYICGESRRKYLFGVLKWDVD